MSDIKKTFNEIALESILFKGQNDWYFCFLKSEKISHVLALLSERVTHSHKMWFEGVVDESSDLPSQIAYFATGEGDVQVALASIFSLISSVRISATRGYLSKETALYIVAEYERLAEKLSSASQPSPFVSPQDFSVPDFLTRPQAPQSLPMSAIPESLMGPVSSYRQKRPNSSPVPPASSSTEVGERSTRILDFVLKNKAVSIKDICTILPAYSEKTVQRELAALIARGLIIREGERRWSVYKPA